MDDFNTDRSGYTTEDFQLWQTNGILVLVPKFQRNSIWGKGAKSFLIDTILRGMVVPPIYLRHTQNKEKTKSIREVVDGQQRIRTVLEFIAPDGYRLSRALDDAPWAGKKFSDLSADQKRQIMNFSFRCETFQGISDEQVLEVFARLNTNGVALNKQELRNGQFFGHFKQLSYKLAKGYLQFWRGQKLFTEQSIARMLNVELTSELLIAGNSGMQDKKTSIRNFYEKWDEEYPSEATDEKRFTETMATISEAFPQDSISLTEFRRPPMFYTLYCVVYHRMYGLPNIGRASPKKKLTSDERESLNDAVKKLSTIIAESKDPANETPIKYKPFLLGSARQTDNINPRKDRFNMLYETAF